MERLETRADSSSTLVRGMALVAQPLNTLLRVKQEAGDEDEKAMEAEMQAGRGLLPWSPPQSLSQNVFSYSLLCPYYRMVLPYSKYQHIFRFSV